jgi:hypothetical protein
MMMSSLVGGYDADVAQQVRAAARVVAGCMAAVQWCSWKCGGQFSIQAKSSMVLPKQYTSVAAIR